MKKLIGILVCSMMLLLGGCGSSETVTPTEKATKPVEETATPTEEKKDEKLSLIGTWKQTNSESEDSYQKAVISEDSIEVYWVSDGGATEALYWAGTYEEATTNDKEYVWSSVNDTEKTSVAIMASDAESKEFRYKNGVISYSLTALGETMTVEMEREDK